VFRRLSREVLSGQSSLYVLAFACWVTLTIVLQLGSCSRHRALNRMSFMLHESLLWPSDGLDKHVRPLVLQETISAKYHPRMSLQSALIGYLISLLLPTPMSPQENVVLQTTATATGTMPLAAGFVGILPALALLEPEKDGSPPLKIDWWNAVLWSLAVAFFGYSHIVFFRCSPVLTLYQRISLPANPQTSGLSGFRIFNTYITERNLDNRRATSLPIGNSYRSTDIRASQCSTADERWTFTGASTRL
jgi:hypothetical protein